MLVIQIILLLGSERSENKPQLHQRRLGRNVCDNEMGQGSKESQVCLRVVQNNSVEAGYNKPKTLGLGLGIQLGGNSWVANVAANGAGGGDGIRTTLGE